MLRRFLASSSSPFKRFGSSMTTARITRPMGVFPSNLAGDVKWDRYVTFEARAAERETSVLSSLVKLDLDENTNWRRVPVEASEGWEEEFLDIVTLPSPMLIPNETEDVLYRDTLFIRNDFLGIYRALFRNRKCVVIGNPSIGKSWLQWTALAFLANPAIFAKLCVDTTPIAASLVPHMPQPHQLPNTVIRHVVGERTFTVWFLREGIVHEIAMPHFDDVAKLLDTPDTVLMWKPDETYKAKVPAFTHLHNMRIWAIAFPLANRFGVFCAQGGVKLYLPCPSKQELLAMGEHLRLHPSTKADAVHFEAEDIAQRIYRFGPFIHCVLPNTIEDLLKMEAMRNNALDKLSASQRLELISKDQIENGEEEVQFWLQRFAVDVFSKDAYFEPSVSLRVASDQLQEQVRSFAETLSERQVKAILGEK